VSDHSKKAETKAGKTADPKKDQPLTGDELEKVSGGRATVVRPFVQLGPPSFVEVQSRRNELQGEKTASRRSLAEIHAELATENAAEAS
jgi:hypothetical protein